MQQIYDQYDAECDISANKYGNQVPVTWAEYELAIQVERLQGQVEDLKQRLEFLETEIRRKDQ
jgi:hypothetical protein